MFEEPVLDVQFDEDVEPLLKMDELEGMSPRNVDGAFVYQVDSCESAAELIHLDGSG